MSLIRDLLARARLAPLALALALAPGCAAADAGPLDPDPPAAAPHPDVALLLDAARSAWRYADLQYQPATGLINSVEGYAYATVWDIASGLAALYSARQLGLLPGAEYERRMGLALRTLQHAPLFDGVALNKNYSTRTGAMAGRTDRDTRFAERGYGWSAIDIGRLLVWLRIVAENDRRFAADARRVVNRIDLSRMVAEGYLWGADVGEDGELKRYPEGRIGYEQYAAQGFALWGARAERALRLHENTLPISVLDVPLVADRRGHDYLTSEPFILSGLELGWDAETADLAARVLRVQEERFRRTGQVTMVSEDHIPKAPHFFYYYAINHHGTQFAIGAQGVAGVLESPRWVSAKAAYAWHGLSPSEYTRRAVDAVAPARDSRGWASGVYEGTAEPTGSRNINTAAVILQTALYAKAGRPLIRTR